MRDRALWGAIVIVLALLTSWAYLQIRGESASLLVYQHEPFGLMGTSSKLVLVSTRDRAAEAEKVLATAESELRRLEALLSTWIEASPISRFNEAAADQPNEIPLELQQVLQTAQNLYRETDGAFDITARPLIELWRDAAARGTVPDDESLTAAREESVWDHVQISDGTAAKRLGTTRVDVDGIAKGYAIDRALEILQRSGMEGGMVEIGGDLRVFGAGPEGKAWTVAIRSPFDEGPWAEIELEEGAVCSSGGYARFLEIDGRRYSHILDPRTGWPTEETQSVTVAGPDAATADAWATALSVLGDAGFELLGESELHALVVTGDAEDYRVAATEGFQQLLVRAIPTSRPDPR